MGLDIRLPIGLMFSILGAILVITGLVGNTSLNTQTGGAMLVFGVVMLVLGIRGQRRNNAEATRGA
jgi:predicted benzoate:H+ symporter BenE